MKKAGLILVAIGIVVFSNGCSGVHSHSYGRPSAGIEITVPVSAVHASWTPRHHLREHHRYGRPHHQREHGHHGHHQRGHHHREHRW